MTSDGLYKLLQRVWNRELSVDDAWEAIDLERERPDDYSKEYWLPISSTEDRQ